MDAFTFIIFPIKKRLLIDAVKQTKWLQDAYVKNIEVITQFREEQHPWVLLAWSTEKEAELQKLKTPWLLTIRETNIKVFSIKAKGEHMFYHPYPRIPSHGERYLEKIYSPTKKLRKHCYLNFSLLYFKMGNIFISLLNYFKH